MIQRYFIEVAYNGANYSGFQVQQNARTIQSEVEKAFSIFYKTTFELTGSSRTDAGVHALQNYFHCDTAIIIENKHCYNLNAILPYDLTITGIYKVDNQAHCRFNAVSREYKYIIYQEKDPFLHNLAWFYPFKIDFDLLQKAAHILTLYSDFTSFSKRNTQVKTFTCHLTSSHWSSEDNKLIYSVCANRFLRGMVRAMVATMLKVGRKTIDLNDFKKIIEEKDCTKADFAAPPHGLYLLSVHYPQSLILA